MRGSGRTADDAARLRDEIGKKVRAFYEDCSFPGYEDFDTPLDLVEKAKRGLYARVLDEQLPRGARILDADCGTGQLSIFLSILQRKVVGADFSQASSVNKPVSGLFAVICENAEALSAAHLPRPTTSNASSISSMSHFCAWTCLTQRWRP